MQNIQQPIRRQTHRRVNVKSDIPVADIFYTNTVLHVTTLTI